MKIQSIYNQLFISRYIDFELIKYFFVGLFNTLISFGIFSFLYFVGLHYFVVSMLNLVIGVAISYFNHRKFTFGLSGDASSRRSSTESTLAGGPAAATREWTSPPYHAPPRRARRSRWSPRARRASARARCSPAGRRTCRRTQQYRSRLIWISISKQYRNTNEN